MEPSSPNLLPLQGKVQHYQWGGVQFLPAFLETENRTHQPFAEYWMGDHPQGDADLIFSDGHRIPLGAFLQKNGASALGPEVFSKFGRLPFLFKVLDVKDMLSIQVHPNKQMAEAGFLREDRQGIARSDPRRNYKDDNHKPELMVALSDFWLLHGFKSPASLRRVLEENPELSFLLADFESNDYHRLYQRVMEMPQDQVNRSLQPLLKRLLPAYQNGQLSKAQEGFWAARAALTFSKGTDLDRGIFSIYLFNLVHLKKGEGIFQDAGMPHAYLEGQNLELMANSDNVLRGGLTPKHIDVPELLAQTRFEETRVNILEGKKVSTQEWEYLTPAHDFALSLIELTDSHPWTTQVRAAEIYLVLEGSVQVSGTDAVTFPRKRGEAWIAFQGASLKMKAFEKARVCRVYYPG